MSDWKQKIEAQIAASDGLLLIETDVVQALLDVAVAAEKVIVPAVGPEADRDYDALCNAIDKLREVGDVYG